MAHFGVAGPGWGSYQAQLLKGRNPYRWLEYSLSASVMIVLIAMLVGINDIAALVALVGVNASMIGFGWMQDRPVDRHNDLPGRAGADGHPPGFVYGIFFSLFVLFNCFAVNQWLQYKQVGKWRDYWLFALERG